MSTRAANEYGFVNARIRGMKSRFLSIGVYESLIQSGSYENFIKILSSTYYGQVLSKESPGSIPNPDELALILSRDFASVSENLSRSLTGNVHEFTKTYLEQFFADSVKSIIRGIHVDLTPDEILRFSVPTSPAQADLLAALAGSSSVSKMIDLLPFWDLKVALLARLPSYEEIDSTSPLEVAVEEWYLKRVMDALKHFSRSEVQRVLSVLESRVVLRNVLTGLRAHMLQLEPRALELSLIHFSRAREITRGILTSTGWREVLTTLERTRYAALGSRLLHLYEDTHNLEDVELAIEDYIAQRIRNQMTAFPFHLGTIIGFFSLKQYEVRNIRSIAVGLERGEPPERIRRMIAIW
ncbi:MAG: V-type ATPase subunit [Candidatus Thorarchaeota archaeon]